MLQAYPDELLVGMIARYHAYSGHSSFKETICEIFHTEGVRPSLNLPSHLSRLAVYGPFGKSAESLVADHTLFPYYRPFLQPGIAGNVRQNMLGDRSLGVHLEAGLVASRVPLHTEMVWCPLCMEEDMRNYGEPYWHRIHHIPGVKVCMTNISIL